MTGSGTGPSVLRYSGRKSTGGVSVILRRAIILHATEFIYQRGAETFGNSVLEFKQRANGVWINQNNFDVKVRKIAIY